MKTLLKYFGTLIKGTCVLIFIISSFPLQTSSSDIVASQTSPQPERVLYGLASYYAQKFQGRQTASGELFDHNKMTAACNVLPLGTWLKVTNLKNKKSIVVKTNDRLHPKTRRIIDLSYAGATRLGYINSGLTRVKIEILKSRPSLSPAP